MKNIIAIVITLLTISNSYSQTKADTSIIITTPGKTIRLYNLNAEDQYDYEYCCNGKSIVIYSIKTDSLSKRNVKVASNGKLYECALKDLNLDLQTIDILKSWTLEHEKMRETKAIRYFEISKEIEAAEAKLELLKSTKVVNKAIQQGLVVTWDWSEEKLVTIKSQSFEFKILNPSKKKIKYIYLTVSIINTVGDFIAKKTLTLVGPIEINDRVSYNFENVFMSNVVGKSQINTIKVEYFDKTAKVFSGQAVNSVIVSEDEYQKFITYLESTSNK
ncbi:hypothetical protein [Lacibacter sediminis]|uniref:Uncharacterized protein n=1 Tax=Lacibacter sediminis TaxID=2760713 RepID=A0A7G5XIA3_9BACT|nr:hypothetical protein [Lacibacter sediminis]QNA45206.1 hypothetical protein H4075_03110 [Lacibacter sediminis]